MVFKTLHIKQETHQKLREFIAKKEIKTFSEGINQLIEGSET